MTAPPSAGDPPDTRGSFAPHSNASPRQLEARSELVRLFRERPFEEEVLLTNLGLYARASALAKVLFVEESYRLIRGLPGDIFLLGIWLGQDVVLFESLRAILEPYNASRTIVGFDTFRGYPALGERDLQSEVVREGGYAVPEGYRRYLDELLAYHRSENCMGHAVRHRLVSGDIERSLPAYLAEHPESSVALAYFDLALYAPTASALSAISDRLLPGSVLVMDELNDPRYKGETEAFREWAAGRSFRIQRSEILPDRTFVQVT